MPRTAATMAERRQTRQIKVGKVAVGGGAPVSVQSMTVTKTADAEATLAQVYALAAAGADIVRCTCNEQEAAEGLAQIVPRSPVPIVADVHFHYEMALAALEAGVQGLRLNPGNLRKPEEIKLVASEARDRGVPIRIGVNAGSLHPELYKKYGGATPEALVESARMELAYFEEVGLRRREDLGQGLHRAGHDRGLQTGFGDLRPPASPRRHRGRPASGRAHQRNRRNRHPSRRGHRRHDPLLADRRPGARGSSRPSASRGARVRERKGLDLIACPSCGRAEIDVIDIARRAQEAFESRSLAAAGGSHGLCRKRSRRGAGGRPRHRRRVATRATCS